MVVVLFPLEVQAAASTATARPLTAARDARPARVNLIVLLQTVEQPNRRHASNRHNLTQPVANRISAASDGRAIRAASPLPGSSQVKSPTVERMACPEPSVSG
jgi:hypothetical protein